MCLESTKFCKNIKKKNLVAYLVNFSEQVENEPVQESEQHKEIQERFTPLFSPIQDKYSYAIPDRSLSNPFFREGDS